MAANSNLNLTSLDFDTLKSNFLTYLKSQDVFKDYNFSGSNMNVLLDIMSYNSYLNAFYLNMVASEMFLDSAQKYDSVISHAKELNYTPQSYKSSEAVINIVFETVGLNGKLVIPKGTIFTGTNSNGTYTFVTSYTANYTSSNNTFYANNVELFEGSYVNDSSVVDYTVENQRFILSNPNIDLTSLTVNVLENNGLSNTLFTRADTLYGLSNTSTIYFVQASQNNQYELVFGDGLFGRVPQNGAVVSSNYRITQGPPADGITKFQLSQSLNSINNGLVNITSLTTVENSTSGSLPETIENIRFRAPRYYATQERGVSNDDYTSLILAKYGSLIEDICTFGGQQVEPKQYGAVIVSIKPYGTTIIPDYLKSEITNYLLDKSQMRVVIQNPDYLYLKVNSSVQYDPAQTSLYSIDLQNLIVNNISKFSANSLEHFNSDFRYSRFTAMIDNTETSIVSNQTDVQISYRLTPLLNYTSSFAFSFNNASSVEKPNSSIGYNSYMAFADEPVLTSTSFTYTLNGVDYPLCFFRDDNVGNIIVYTDINSVFTILNSNIGTIDYTTGNITINNFLTSYYDQYISIYMRPMEKDVIVNKNKILLIDPNDVTINIVEKTA